MNDETRGPSAPPGPPAPTGAAPSVPEHQDETLVQSPSRADAAKAAGAPAGKATVPGYEILGELGRGGMGVVYRARHVTLNRVAALKMVLGAQHADPRELARFVAEARAVAEIRHPNVIQVFDSGEADGHPFMAMECMDGGSLSQRLRAAGRLAPRAAAELLVKIASGVQAAHDRGIVHRDLKPHNVLLDAPPAGGPPGAWGEPKVTDFGLAKRGGAELTTTGAVLGTPAYMAPEQARGDTRNVGPAADVYALGVILYECLCGSVPFRGSDAWSVIRQVVDDAPEPLARRFRDIPVELDLICHKCLEKDPAARYASAAALADDLRRYLNGEAIRGPRTGVWYAGLKAARRWWRPIAAACALVALVVVAWLIPSPLDWLRGAKPPDRPPDRPPDPLAALLREEIVQHVADRRRTPPAPDRTSPHPVAPMAAVPPIDGSRFKVFRDERVMDLRAWRPAGAESAVVYFTRREMMKLAAADDLRVEARAPGRDVVTRALRPKAEKARAFAFDAPGDRGAAAVRHLVFDVHDIPVNQEFTLRYTVTVWNALRTDDDNRFEVTGSDGAVKTSMLVLFPDGRPFRGYRVRSAPARDADPTTHDDPRAYAGPVIALEGDDKSWLYWEIPNPKANEFYCIDWTW
jgi:tRNA A-37 threonylcarbamoyl transferase component Bud32